MIEPKEIPHLLMLLEDEDLEVQETAIDYLSSFGPNLQRELKFIPFSLSDFQQRVVDCIIEDQSRVALRKSWLSCLSIRDEWDRLEKALQAISQYLHKNDALELTVILDQITKEYRKKFYTSDARMLAHYLFRDKGIVGNNDDYYNPQNSNLYNVLIKKKGIPISLSSLYLLLGKRMNLEIEACPYPGHFLTRIKVNEKIAYVDCFNKGQIIWENDLMLLKKKKSIDVEQIVKETADCTAILKRYLANLIRCYQVIDDELNQHIFVQLFQDLEDFQATESLKGINIDEMLTQLTPQFNSGQVVRHTKYHYRGIICGC